VLYGLLAFQERLHSLELCITLSIREHIFCWVICMWENSSQWRHKFFLFLKHSDWCWGSLKLQLIGYHGAFFGVKQMGCKIYHSPSLVLRLMSGILILLPIFAFKTCIGITFPSSFHVKQHLLVLQVQNDNQAS